MSADQVVLRCVVCGKEKPNDLAWARSAMCCGQSRWVGSVTFTPTHDGVVAHGDIHYGLSVPERAGEAG